MMETSPFWTALEELFKVLLMVLSGDLASGPKEVQPEELARLARLPTQSTLLFLEPDGELIDEDVRLLKNRMNAMNIATHALEYTESHLILFLHGQRPDISIMQRVVKPGHLTMAAIDHTDDWMDFIPDELRRGFDTAGLPQNGGITPALSSTNRTAIQRAMPYLEKNGLMPFILESREPPDKGALVHYFLGVLSSEPRITDVMWQSAQIEQDAYTPIKHTVRLTLSPQGQARLKTLTENNIGQPLAIVLDGEALSIPIVTEEIRGNSIVISPIRGYISDFSFDVHVREILLLNAIIRHAPLHTPWKIVHMAPLP